MASLVFLYIHFQNPIKPEIYLEDNIESTAELTLKKINIKPFEKKIDHIYKYNKNENAVMLPLIILNTRSCALCINNIVEYTETIEGHRYFIDPILVFVDEEYSIVERFLATSNIDANYSVISSSDLKPIVYNQRQKIVFINLDNRIILSDLEVPNFTTSLTKKENDIKDVISLWKHSTDNDS